MRIDANRWPRYVPYKGSGAAIQDLLAGQVQVFMSTPPAVMQHVQTDKVKAALATPEAKSVADRTGIDIRHLGPDALAGLVQRETVNWGQIIKAHNINPDQTHHAPHPPPHRPDRAQRQHHPGDRDSGHAACA